jgi:hypothetical protein
LRLCGLFVHHLIDEFDVFRRANAEVRVAANCVYCVYVVFSCII